MPIRTISCIAAQARGQVRRRRALPDWPGCGPGAGFCNRTVGSARCWNFASVDANTGLRRRPARQRTSCSWWDLDAGRKRERAAPERLCARPEQREQQRRATATGGRHLRVSTRKAFSLRSMLVHRAHGPSRHHSDLLATTRHSAGCCLPASEYRDVAHEWRRCGRSRSEQSHDG